MGTSTSQYKTYEGFLTAYFRTQIPILQEPVSPVIFAFRTPIKSSWHRYSRLSLWIKRSVALASLTTSRMQRNVKSVEQTSLEGDKCILPCAQRCVFHIKHSLHDLQQGKGERWTVGFSKEEHMREEERGGGGQKDISDFGGFVVERNNLD